MTGRANPVLAVFAALAAAVLGVVLAYSIPSAVFPEITFNRATILAESSDLPPEQMLVAVTRPLEEAAYGVVGVSLVRSTTTRGSSEVDVTFADGADPTQTYQLLNAALGEVRGRLPAATTLDTRLLTTGTFPIIDLSMSSRDRDLAALTDIAFYDVAPSFHRIPGVYRVELVGGKYREYVVRLEPAEMLAYGLSPQQVVDGLRKANVIASAGRVEDLHRMLLTVVTSDLHQADQLAALAIASINGHPVHVRDIGSVELGIREDYIRTSSEHGPAVLIGVSRQPSGNTELIAAQIRRLVAQFRTRYPDVTFTFSYDQSALVATSFNSVRDAIVLGLALAVAVVLVFTMSPLNALIAAIVVPCTIAITIAVMKAAGMTFNMMTLGGLAAGIGLFIDDAIVMIEAIHRARSQGVGTGAAVDRATHELGRPLVASTFTVIVVFIPLIFLSGVTGVFFRALAVTLGSGLAISLLLALYFTPALEMAFERLRGASHPAGRIFKLFTKVYLLSTRPFIRFPVAAPLLAVASLAVAFGLYRSLGTDYLPPMDEGAFILDYTTPPQSTLADTDALVGKIEQVLKTTPEVVAFSRRTGTQLGFFLTESNRGDISVRLTPNRRRGIEQIMDSVRRRILASVPGVRIEFSQVLQDLIGDLSGTPEPVEVKVFGADQDTIESTARQVAGILRQVPGTVDVFDGIVLSNPEQEIQVDPTAAGRYGLNAQDIDDSLHAIVEGTVATELRVHDRLFGVRVRYPDSFHQNLQKLAGVLLDTPAHGKVPLSSLAKFRWLGERPELDRERLRSVIHVTARLSGVNLGDAMAQVRRRLSGLALPAGITLEYGGLYAEQQKAFSQLTMVLIAGTVGMFLIVLWEFRRLAPALAVMIAALACLAGSFAALRLTDITLNISSFMGIIMVVGIAAKNGILLLDQAEHDTAGGETPAVAVISAARIRLRPILMTTVATAAGLLPLALGLGAGAKVQQPLAVAVIGGLAFALVLITPIAAGVYVLGTRRRPRES
ncbi:MAG TPA: efflux RND transporter permease subunit [Candidatus Binataceae bacterium]|nr:efflux RND transporter permease subunit [Candidatus Binataceae bacterium]